jgi:hypothetical protein
MFGVTSATARKTECLNLVYDYLWILLASQSILLHIERLFCILACICITTQFRTTHLGPTLLVIVKSPSRSWSGLLLGPGFTPLTCYNSVLPHI